MVNASKKIDSTSIYLDSTCDIRFDTTEIFYCADLHCLITFYIGTGITQQLQF